MDLKLLHNKLFAQANAAYERDDFKKAEKFLDNILSQDPQHTHALTLLARTHARFNRNNEAIACLEKLIVLEPNEYSHFSNLGLIYQQLNQPEKCQQYLKRALELKPNSVSALLNVGYASYDNGDFKTAEEFYRKIFTIKPDWNRAHYNLALVLLTLGRYEEGWQEFEYRLGAPEWSYLRRNIITPPWKGEDLSNKSLLVYSEQGFGDMIQFARFLSLVKRPDNEIILEVHKPVVRLFKSIPWADKVTVFNEPLPVFDYHISLLSLPYASKCTTELGQAVPYIFSEPEKKAFWKEKLASIKKRKIGICWSGNPLNKINNRRSCPLQEMLPYYLMPQVQLINLTKDYTPDEKKLLDDNNVLDFFDCISDFSDTAALIDNLDLVISVDTSISHLCGAMNKPIWMMLYHFPEWRYLLDPHKNPWYPSMILFRQKQLGDWSGVFSRIQKELKSWLQ
jgi:hypothetical protein